MRAVGARSAAKFPERFSLASLAPAGSFGFGQSRLRGRVSPLRSRPFAAEALRERRCRGWLAGAAGRLTAPRSRCCSAPISFSASTAMASITRRWSAAPVTTASSCVSHRRSSAPRRAQALCRAQYFEQVVQAGAGRHTDRPQPEQVSAFFRPLMILARVAGAPTPFAPAVVHRRAFMKRQAFCMASISVPSL